MRGLALLILAVIFFAVLLPHTVFSAEEDQAAPEQQDEASVAKSTEDTVEGAGDVEALGEEEVEAEEKQSEEPVRAVSHNVSIKIEADEIFPKKVQVNPGTTIVWINNTGAAIKVRFTSTAVSTTCKAPRGFGIGPAGIFVSEKIREGGVASLCFLEPNEYAYEVDYLPAANSGQTQVTQTLPGQVLVGG